MASHNHDCTLCTTHPLSDLDVVQRVLDGDTALFEVILHRYNQRLYRVARAILVDDTEAEDAIQQAYINGPGDRGQVFTWLLFAHVRTAQVA